ncbi:hypothetical protein FACS1894105_07390 [Clostridia bacterium]|nr:hypothetical protein FACS1894105_07390 [Clostridia bacterium]
MSIKHRPDSLAGMRVGLPTAKEAKLTEISAACEAAIFAGVDAETSKGTEHFSLTLNDQTNIGNLALQAAQGSPVLYHADGELCRLFAPEEFIAIATAATVHKTIHTTRCNHINVWIRRTEDDAKLDKITYSAKLPKDLADNIEKILGEEANG